MTKCVYLLSFLTSFLPLVVYSPDKHHHKIARNSTDKFLSVQLCSKPHSNAIHWCESSGQWKESDIDSWVKMTHTCVCVLSDAGCAGCFTCVCAWVILCVYCIQVWEAGNRSNYSLGADRFMWNQFMSNKCSKSYTWYRALCLVSWLLSSEVSCLTWSWGHLSPLSRSSSPLCLLTTVQRLEQERFNSAIKPSKLFKQKQTGKLIRKVFLSVWS